MKALARVFVAGVLLLAALLAAAYSAESLTTWWLELLHYVPYPAYLVPALVAFGVSLTLGRWWRVAAALGVLLVAGVLMGFVAGRADTGSGRVRMMTYNIKAYRAELRPGGFEQLAQEVAAHDPDILVMQDAGELTQWRRQAPEVAASIFAGRQVFESGQYIVVSRFPLRNCGRGDLSYSNVIADYARCIVTIDGVDIDLVTAHLLSPRRGLNATRREAVEGIDDWQQNFGDRLTQARKLATVVAGRSRPMILAGDLNAAESSSVIRVLLERGLRDAFSSAGVGYGYTHGHASKAGFSFLRIDHILISDEIGVADAFPGGWQASEHRPVIADLLMHRSR
ncbi:MAG: endonuclease/exonuclease/phosphatase family protein [Burkholderiales bacterium]